MSKLTAPFVLTPEEAALVARTITCDEGTVNGSFGYRRLQDAELAMALFERLMDDLEQATN